MKISSMSHNEDEETGLVTRLWSFSGDVLFKYDGISLKVYGSKLDLVDRGEDIYQRL